jgi:hypothetical protein
MPTPRIARPLPAWLMLALSLAAATAWGNRAVRIYEVDLHGGQTPAALQDAMREALVRATGRRESATDPAFAALIAAAPSYVKGYDNAARGGTQVVFDAAAVERAIVAAGRTVWEDERPFTLVMLYPPLPRAAEESARTELERAAIARGLPISLIPVSPLDSSGNELNRTGLMQLAQKYGGDAVLVGRADVASPSARWQWTLHTNFTSESWSGPLAAGIDNAVDNLAAPQGATLAETEAEARIQIEGVNGLSDYAAVERILASLPGARRSGVVAADGSQVVFQVLIRGGSGAVSRALSGSTHLVAAEAAGNPLTYQYRP